MWLLRKYELGPNEIIKYLIRENSKLPQGQSWGSFRQAWGFNQGSNFTELSKPSSENQAQKTRLRNPGSFRLLFIKVQLKVNAQINLFPAQGNEEMQDGVATFFSRFETKFFFFHSFKSVINASGSVLPDVKRMLDFWERSSRIPEKKSVVQRSVSILRTLKLLLSLP